MSVVPLTGELLIAGAARQGQAGAVHAFDASTGARLEPGFGKATLNDLEDACAAAQAAFRPYRALAYAERAAFLDAIAEEIEAIGDDLTVRAMAETGLPRARLEGERGRTCGQLRLFAQVVRDGGFLDARIDPAQPDRAPAPRLDLRLRNVPLGPVAVFGASNFPLAFSVAGGDTASALAAGCPVIVKAHSAHPGVSELVGRAVQAAVAKCGLPAGVFAMLHGDGREIGQGLVADPRIKAVGFTGSRAGGLALVRTAQARPVPIPVYAEMSSINPVILLPAALAARAEPIANAFVAALTLGAGQFCTNPGLVLAVDGPDLDTFIQAASAAVAAAPAQVMLTAGIRSAYENGVTRLGEVRGVSIAGVAAPAVGAASPALFAVSGRDFLAHPELTEEVFGAASLVVRCQDLSELRTITEGLEGQLTVAVHVDAADHSQLGELLPSLELLAGRVLVNGFGTGVEVAHAMVHGGPYPSTSDGRATSVGSLAIARFLRPVCYQNLPDPLLPDELKATNPLVLHRRIDGALTAP
ncbi:aldehyde dehydrogenase (NADP(+)) [Caulobacter vibrioides]|uniref:2,5-dioxovalerate dehydrogenase n=1 Tax=Caulobacter vibrioides TaxID=155892 RepID=A0A290MY28_CAUVI|nr:aldehyde dehydrogenase (NADP(+)) [Caulobacter vibrioides]ATC32141.1 aldehyde dehydrogenase (NADP(+)) [Caulobacter vibrioides]